MKLSLNILQELHSGLCARQSELVSHLQSQICLDEY